MDGLEGLSLKRIDISGNVVGKFSAFCIHQEYANDTDAVLEVMYTFPISASATVTGFTALVGEKIIKGVVKEKDEAQKGYEKAMAKGDSAYLMTNDESNIFQMNIGKIAVGETVVVKIDYIDNFEIINNQIRLIIPTLVPPRYKSAVTDKLAYAKNEVDYRGHLTIGLDKELKIDNVWSKTHTIKLANNTIFANDIKLDRDFVVDIQLEDQSFSKGYSCDLPNGRKVVYLSFFPEIEMECKNKPKDYIFVIDISGSMEGYKLEQTKEAVVRCLKLLREGDKFNVIIFDTDFELFSEEIMAFNPDNYKKVEKYVQSLCSRGGTELFSAVKEAVEQFGNEKIIFLFTDGEVGNEFEIAGYVRQHIGRNSLFIFGIDSSVNKNGLEAIAEAGRGKAEFITRDENLKEIIIRQFARVSSLNLFEIGINPKLNKVTDKIEKQRVLFNREFYDVLLEVEAITDDFELQCKTDAETYSFVVEKDKLEYPDLPLHKIYASELIRRLEKYIERQPYKENKGYKEQIVEIAVEYQINSKYTAFLAVNERDEKLTDIPQLQETVLESPAGWDMDMSNYSQKYQVKKRQYYHSVNYLFANDASTPFASHSSVYEPCTDTTKGSQSVHSSEKPSAKNATRKNSSIKDMMQSIVESLFEEDSSTKSPADDAVLDRIYQRIKECEALIVKNEDYQFVLDVIIESLRDLSIPNAKAFEKWIKKIEKKAPHVYELIKTELSNLSKK